MSKRKVTAGGYEDSSDDPDIEQAIVLEPPVKKPKPAYAPPRLSVATQLGIGEFQLPRLKPPFVRPSATPSVIRALPTRSRPAKGSATPEIEGDRNDDGEALLNRVSSDSEPEVIASQTSSVPHMVNPKGRDDRLLVPPKSGNARSTLSLERQVNELADNFGKHKESVDAQQKRMDEKLTRVLEVVSRLAPEGVTPGQAPPGRSASMSPAATDAKPFLCNPMPTAELISIVSKVVSEARNRVGKKRGGADDNSLKEHARATFYRMLGIQAAKEIRPYFEDRYGEPDTLPEQFIDPETGYCQPYPHWKAQLIKQVAWIPTYVLRFRSTILNDQSELSNRLRSLSDEQIIILLSDGPFKSAQTAWRDMKKSDDELEVMRSCARRYQRVERKSVVRAGYIKTIPSLQGSEWDFLSHPGYMSPDESDDERGLVTQRPEHRAQWVANLYEAIRVAELEKTKARSNCPSNLPKRNIDPIPLPIPRLERGTGSGKFVVRIAACGISGSWKKECPDDYKRYAHLINAKVSDKPDIKAFLSRYPMQAVSVQPEERNQVNEVSMDCGSSESNEGVEIGVFGLHAAEGEEAQGVEDNGLPSNQEEPPTVGLPRIHSKGEGVGAVHSGDADDIPIDPQLLAADAHDFAGQLQNTGHLPSKVSNDTTDEGAMPHLANTAPRKTASMQGNSPMDPGVDPAATHTARSPIHNPQMPSPPPLDHGSGVPTSNSSAGKNVPQTRTRRASTKQGRTPSSSAAKAPAAEPKKRGRPPGSKNKPKPSA